MSRWAQGRRASRLDGKGREETTSVGSPVGVKENTPGGCADGEPGQPLLWGPRRCVGTPGVANEGGSSRQVGSCGEGWACLNAHNGTQSPRNWDKQRGKELVAEWRGKKDASLSRRFGWLQVGKRDVRVKRFQPRATGGGVRGEVWGLSYQSGQRLVWTVRNGEPELTGLATVTYPAEYPTDGRLVKKHLKALEMWFSRRDIGGVWFEEWQKRGAPHFHLLLTGRVCKDALAWRWFQIVGSGDPVHLAAGTRIEALRYGQDGAASYAAKYARKEAQKVPPDDFHSPGRMWGRFGGFQVASEWVEGTWRDLAPIVRVAKSRYKVLAGKRFRDDGLKGMVIYGAGPVVSQYTFIRPPGAD